MHGSMQNVAPVIDQAHPGGMLQLAFFAAKQDPVAYREELLGHNPRALAFLLLAAKKAGWGSPLPLGHGRGTSVQFAYGSYTSQVAEVEVAADGSIKVKAAGEDALD